MSTLSATLIATLLLSMAVAVPLSANGQVYATTTEQTEKSPQTGLTSLVTFNASRGQLPEGIAILGDTAYLSFAPLAQVVGASLSNGSNQNASFAEFGSWPDIPENQGFMTGLTFDAQENLYAAIGSQTPEVQSGVYRVEITGGNATLFATHPEMQFPNALVFDQELRHLYISDSGAGAIFVAFANGTVAEWISDPLLQGNSSFCQNVPDLGMNVGANGMVLDKSERSLFVANSDQASIVRVPIGINGSAGEPEVFAGPDCENLAGADGMVIDKQADDLIVSANKLDQIVRVSIANGTVSVMSSGRMLDFPASLAIVGGQKYDNFVDTFGLLDANATTDQANRTLYIANFALLSAQGNQTANPALLSMELVPKSNATTSQNTTIPGN